MPAASPGLEAEAPDGTFSKMDCVDGSVGQKDNTNNNITEVLGLGRDEVEHIDFQRADKVVLNRYSDSSIGPYTVSVQSIKENIGMYHETKLGKIFLMNKVQGIMELHKISKNKIQVEFMTAAAANMFVSSAFLEQHQLKAYIPTSKIQRVGVVHNIDISITDEELRDYIKSEIIIIKVQRIVRRVKNAAGEIDIIPTKTVKIWFLGQSLPTRVYLYYNALIVKPFVFGVIQCRNCYRFGHVQDQCKSSTRCANCALDHFTAECTQKEINCVNCDSTEHCTTDRSCPKYLRQQQIKKIMAIHNCAFHEVFNICPELHEPKKRMNRKNDLNPSDFPPLSLHSDAANISERQYAQRSWQRHIRASAEVQSSTQKRHQVTEYTCSPKSQKMNQVRKPGFHKMAYNEALLQPNGRGSMSRTQDNISTPGQTGAARENLTTNLPTQNSQKGSTDYDMNLSVAVNNLEQLLLASANPVFKSLAKMIRSAIKAPYRPLIIIPQKGDNNI